MSLYEIITMRAALGRRRKGVVRISDEEWEESQQLLADLAARDPSVRV